MPVSPIDDSLSFMGPSPKLAEASRHPQGGFERPRGGVAEPRGAIEAPRRAPHRPARWHPSPPPRFRSARRGLSFTGMFLSVERIHRSTAFHWVGNGFQVSTYFPSRGLPSERVSPFVLMDYGPPKEFTPLERGKRG